MASAARLAVERQLNELGLRFRTPAQSSFIPKAPTISGLTRNRK